MSATDLQVLLRFLSQDAKVPLASAMSKVKELQKADLDTPDKLAKAKPEDLKSVFPDEKIAKQVVSAAKRVAKKRAAGDDSASSPNKKKKRNESLFSEKASSPAEIEASLELPTTTESEDELEKVVLFTNRAPLALAFVFTLLKHSMPEQPLSSRLSLAQGYIGVTSKARALYLGIDSGRSAEEEGFGEGQPVVRITGKEVRVLRRWGYEWKEEAAAAARDEPAKVGSDGTVEANECVREVEGDAEPPLWALDLEALKKANTLESVPALGQSQNSGKSNLPIHTPQSARAYLLKAFDVPPEGPAEQTKGAKKPSYGAKAKEKERNLGRLLKALDLLYESWAVVLNPEDLDKRTWGWYVKVRPSVEDGAAGWGGKNTLKLADILALRRPA